MAVLWSFLLYCLLVVSIKCIIVNGEAEMLDRDSIERYKAEKKLVLINFYADWCRYSAALKPIYDKAADQVASETSDAMMGKVDCERNKPLCIQDFHINKYPTIKIIRNKELTRKEYRGQRTVEALVSFVKKQVENPIQFVSSYVGVLDKLEGNAKAAVGFFPTNYTSEYETFSKVAFSLKDDCKFFAIVNSGSAETQITFKEQGSSDQQFNGDASSFDTVFRWLSERCLPLVREITFQNGEELTEEGLPFFILFYHPDHTDIKTVFKRRVEEELINFKGSVNFVTADGIKFAHPLSHLGKSKKDLPVLAIDSFRHMYVFPNFDDIHIPGKMTEFVNDLHSGKLHREFHQGPDHHQHQPVPHQQVPNGRGGGGGGHDKRAAGDPPESTFKKLQPAKSRYSFVNHDEL